MTALLFATLTAHYQLPPKIISSICYVETRHQEDKINFSDGGSPSYGICQVKLETAQFLGFEGSEEELMDPEINIKYAAKYFRHQLDRYQGNVQKAIIAYNRGSAKNFTKTKYSDKVNNIWRGNK